VRTTGLAVVVVGLAVAAGMAMLVHVFRESLLGELEISARLHASELAEDVAGGLDLRTVHTEDLVVQLVDRDGDKIGSIEEIYLDAETNEPEWALVNTGMFGTKSSFVPLRDASPEGDGVRVPFEKAQVKEAPRIDPDGRLSQNEESELYRHYGLEYSEADSGSGLPEGGEPTGTVGRDVSGPTTDTR